jgi:hypothetical protein
LQKNNFKNLKKKLIFIRIFFKIWKFFWNGLQKIPWLGLVKKQKLLFIVQNMLKNIFENYGPVFPYFWEKKFQSLGKILLFFHISLLPYVNYRNRLKSKRQYFYIFLKTLTWKKIQKMFSSGENFFNSPKPWHPCFPNGMKLFVVTFADAKSLFSEF